MENLSEKVYECTLGVEAHMICDLLARAGISARVDGEFLQGAAGELPLGSGIKVRVAPENAAEARAVIDEWEKTQPPPEPAAPARRPPWRSPLWFVLGFLMGGAVIAYAMRSPATSTGVDYDGDGDFEITYHYAGTTITSTEIDRNNDGRVDARWLFDMQGIERSFEADDDFDGRFEWQAEVERGELHTSRRDADGDGVADEIWHAENGVLRGIDYFDGRGLVSRHQHEHGRRISADFDRDGDGTFEQHVEFDRFDMPR